MDHTKISKVSMPPAHTMSPLWSTVIQENWTGRGEVKVRKLRYLPWQNDEILEMYSFFYKLNLYNILTDIKSIFYRLRSQNLKFSRLNIQFYFISADINQATLAVFSFVLQDLTSDRTDKCYLLRSNALTVPSSDEDRTTCPFWVKVTPVTPPRCSLNVTKQNPLLVFHSFTWKPR